MRPFRVGERLTQPRMEDLRRIAEAKSLGSGFAGGGAPVLVANHSGTAIDLGQALGIAGMDFAISESEGTFLSQIILRGVTPDLATHEFKYAVALEPIAADAVGRCALDGLVRVRLNVIDEFDHYAIVDDGEVVLASHWFGNARILAKETEAGSGTGSNLTTGEMWAVVRLNDPSEMKFVGKTDEDGIPAGGSGSVVVYKYDSPVWTPLERAGEETTLVVRHPPSEGDVDDVAGGSWVQGERECVANHWIVDVEYCPPEGT